MQISPQYPESIIRLEVTIKIFTLFCFFLCFVMGKKQWGFLIMLTHLRNKVTRNSFYILLKSTDQYRHDKNINENK